MNERIRELRKALNITQQELADKLSLKRNTIATYEMGKATPSDRTVADICREYNVSEEWLRAGTGEMFVPVTRDEEIEIFIGNVLKDEPDNFKKRLISVLAKLSKHEWEVLEEKARWLVQESEAQQKGTDYFSPRSALMW